MSAPAVRRHVGPTGAIARLVGSWALKRTIDNGASMTGEAVFAGGAGCFNYVERGLVRLPNGHFLDAERRHVFMEHDGGFSVLFAESPPRLFHRIVLRQTGPSLTGDGRHRCGDDRYDSRYAFRADGSFTIEHRVAGPRKGYAILTEYTRRPAQLNN